VNFVFLRVAAKGSIPAKTIAWMKSFFKVYLVNFVDESAFPQTGKNSLAYFWQLPQ
jgi:hypothetical protein